MKSNRWFYEPSGIDDAGPKRVIENGDYITCEDRQQGNGRYLCQFNLASGDEYAMGAIALPRWARRIFRQLFARRRLWTVVVTSVQMASLCRVVVATWRHHIVRVVRAASQYGVGQKSDGGDKGNDKSHGTIGQFFAFRQASQRQSLYFRDYPPEIGPISERRHL